VLVEGRLVDRDLRVELAAGSDRTLVCKDHTDTASRGAWGIDNSGKLYSKYTLERALAVHQDVLRSGRLKLHIAPASSTITQQWTMTASGVIESLAAPGMVLEVDMSLAIKLAPRCGTPCVQQQWRISSNGIISSAADPDLVLTAEKSDVAIELLEPLRAHAQRWLQLPCRVK
jgi:hypothetical protein